MKTGAHFTSGLQATNGEEPPPGQVQETGIRGCPEGHATVGEVGVRGQLSVGLPVKAAGGLCFPEGESQQTESLRHSAERESSTTATHIKL